MDTAVAAISLDPRPLKKGVDEVGRQLDRIPKKTKSMAANATKGFRDLSKSIFSIRGTIVSAFAGLSFASIIGEGRQFGKALGDLSAITGATGADLEYLADKSREFGAQTTLTAVEAAQAFKLIASAKPDLLENGAALAEVTEQAIILAEASGQDLPAAASALGASLNQFSAGAESASQFINVLAEGSKRGAASIAETSEALKFAGVVAADAGLSFETTVAAIQQLSKVAIKGGEAGTGLRNVILRLASTGERELDPAVVGLSKALENLNEKQLSTVELTEIFGLRSVVAAKSLLTQVDSLRQLEAQVTNTNTALEQQAARVNNLDGDIKQLGSAYSELKIGLEEAADDGLRAFTQSLTDVFRAIGENIDAVTKLIKVLGMLAATVVAAKVFGPLIVGITTGVLGLTKALAAFRLGLIASQVAMTGTIGVLGALRIAFMTLGGPVGVVIAAVGAFFAIREAFKETEVSATELTGRINRVGEAFKDMNRDTLEVAAKDAALDLKLLSIQASNAGQEVFKLATRLESAEEGTPAYKELADELARAEADASLLADRMSTAGKIVKEIKTHLAGFDFMGPVASPEQLAATAAAATKALTDQLDDLSQRGRMALKGVFPEQEQINKLKDAQAAITQLKNEFKSAPDAVRKELEAEGVTLERLDAAYNEHAKSIDELKTKQAELSGVQKAYKTELDKVNRALWLAEEAAKADGRSTAQLGLAYEFAEGKLKKLAGTSHEAALTDKFAAAEKARLNMAVDQQIKSTEKANKFAALAAKQGHAITQSQALQFELTEGALKDLNDEKKRTALITQAAIADDIRLTAEADAIRDTLDPLAAYNKEVENLSRLHKAGKLTTDEFTEAMRRSALQNNEAAGIIRDEFGSVFGELLNGTQSVSDAFKAMGSNIIKSLNDLIGKKVGEQLFDSLFNVGAAKEGTTGIAQLFSGGGAPAAGGPGATEDEGGILDKVKGAVGSLFQGGVLGPDAAPTGVEMLYTTANPLPVRIVSGAGGGLTGGLQAAAGGFMGPMPQSPEEKIQEDAGNGFADFFGEMGEGAGSLWESVKGGFDTVIGGIGSGFDAAISGVAGLFGGGGSGAMHGDDYLALAGNMAASYYSGGGGGAGGAAGGGNFAVSDFQKLQGFAGGGDFRVGGGGGIDSQMVAFRASPNERVRVTRPQDNAAGTVQVNNTFNITAEGGNVSESTQKQMAGRIQTSVAMAQRRTQ